MTVPINAPLTEIALARSLRRYERVKLALLVAVLVVVLVSGVYLVALTNADHHSLVILRCVVDRTVQFDKNGVVRTPEASRRVFDACVARG